MLVVGLGCTWPWSAGGRCRHSWALPRGRVAPAKGVWGFTLGAKGFILQLCQDSKFGFLPKVSSKIPPLLCKYKIIWQHIMAPLVCFVWNLTMLYILRLNAALSSRPLLYTWWPQTGPNHFNKSARFSMLAESSQRYGQAFLLSTWWLKT